MRLIDADELLERISAPMTLTGARAWGGVLREALIAYRKAVLWIVDSTPTIEAEPVRHGRWVKKHQTYTCGNMTLSGVYPTCTLCGHAEIGVDKSTPYCPNCGAKMDLKGD